MTYFTNWSMIIYVIAFYKRYTIYVCMALTSLSTINILYSCFVALWTPKFVSSIDFFFFFAFCFCCKMSRFTRCRRCQQNIPGKSIQHFADRRWVLFSPFSEWIYLFVCACSSIQFIWIFASSFSRRLLFYSHQPRRHIMQLWFHRFIADSECIKTMPTNLTQKLW